MLTWAHCGDIHVSHEDGHLGISRLKAKVAEANRYLADTVDFVFLPGDNANNGSMEQYQRIGDALSEIHLPVHAIPGDHDVEPGTLNAFYRMHGAHPLPMAVTIGGRSCVFLDIVSPGSGRPDFRLGETQLRWLEQQLEKPSAAAHRPVVFMHAYPGDLHEHGGQIGRLFAKAHVAMVDTGHTHYNALLNDGSVTYASTRSMAQVEEGDGEAGFSIAAVDGSSVSWRFKTPGSTWPFVAITSPADRRLETDISSLQQVPTDTITVRMRVFGDDIRAVTVSVDDGKPVLMRPVDGENGAWCATVPETPDACSVIVHAQSGDGGSDEDRIDGLTPQAAASIGRPDALPGTNAHAVEAWPEHGILGSQLGPNKYGRKL
ncbi:metallophosphoesterase family protein [Rhodanobacter sp. BL-MT-08]